MSATPARSAGLAARAAWLAAFGFSTFALGAALAAGAVRAADLLRVEVDFALDLLFGLAGLALAFAHAAKLARAIEAHGRGPGQAVQLVLLALPSLAFAALVFVGPV